MFTKVFLCFEIINLLPLGSSYTFTSPRNNIHHRLPIKISSSSLHLLHIYHHDIKEEARRSSQVNQNSNKNSFHIKRRTNLCSLLQEEDTITSNETTTTITTTTEISQQSYFQSIYSLLKFNNASSSMELFLPIVDNATTSLLGTKILSYADLYPETERTPGGVAFLATNLVYVIAGYMLAFQGNLLLGFLTEIAGIVSFWYHFSQLKFGTDRAEVRLALFTDYLTAGSTILTGGWYAITQVGLNYIPYDVLFICFLSIVCLSLSWVWEYGLPYLFWHSLWHLFSAYGGYLVGIQAVTTN